jgi:hypothetical protein
MAFRFMVEASVIKAKIGNKYAPVSLEGGTEGCVEQGGDNVTVTTKVASQTKGNGTVRDIESGHPNTDLTSEADSAACEKKGPTTTSPWWDPVLLVMGVAMFFVGIQMVGQMLLPPLLLANESFGLQRSTVCIGGGYAS